MHCLRTPYYRFKLQNPGTELSLDRSRVRVSGFSSSICIRPGYFRYKHKPKSFYRNTILLQIDCSQSLYLNPPPGIFLADGSKPPVMFECDEFYGQIRFVTRRRLYDQNKLFFSSDCLYPAPLPSDRIQPLVRLRTVSD